MKDSPWVPFWMPFVVFGIVAIVLPSLGMLLLNIALATSDMFPAIHSWAVIITALVIGAIITVVAAVYARSGSQDDAPSTRH